MYQPRKYKLNTKLAAADGVGGGISETGLYIGEFVSAEVSFSPSNYEGIEFTFKSDQGQEARYISIALFDNEGKPMEGGHERLNALMCCMQVREMNPVGAKVKKRNPVNGQEELTDVITYPELVGPKVGLLLRKNIYTRKSGANAGKDGYSMDIYQPFNPETKQLAAEMIAKEEATKLMAMAEGLTDRDSRKSGASAPQASAQATAADDDFDDDIPF